MNHLRKARKWTIVFRGLVLALAFVLVACGSDSDDPDPTATTGAEQDAVPTAPTLDNTPDSDVNEGDITVLDPDIPATAESSPETDTAATSEASDASTPEAEVGTETDSSTPAAETNVATAESEEEVDLVGTPMDSGETAPASPEAGVAGTPEDVIETPATAVTTGEAEAMASPTVRPLTGNETYTNPGDGTGGSGMPGESSSGETESPVASPSASPVAQFSIEGCEVPDVPNYVGENTGFTLTADLNFRAGPGVNCDPLMDEPLGEGQTVTVTGGPVIQSEDGSEWVQIDIDGTTGWISTEFIEPTE